MTAFFTKKQKNQMRERQRRKKKLLTNNAKHKVDNNKNNNNKGKSQPPNGKKDMQQHDDDVDDKPTKKSHNKNGRSIEIVKGRADAGDDSQEEMNGIVNALISNSSNQISHPQPNNNNNNKNNNNKKNNKNNKNDHVIIIPSNLSTAEARKKFRKDARRKAREQGQDDTKLEFVVEGSAAETTQKEQPSSSSSATNSNSTSTTKHTTKTSKRAFPCLKELVEQEREAKRRRLLAEQRQQEESALTEEYKARYVALDCEMVGIGSQGRTSALARVSLVDWYGRTVLDTFVKVPTRVTDFRTHVSGVTPQHLKQDHAMDVSACRDQVAALLKHKILVGHALHNDLSALMLQHPREDRRDTATYRPFQRCSHHSKSGGGGNKIKWRPRKLRDLVKEHLQLVIQSEGHAHDSVQDAWATMQLFQTVRANWEQELEQKQQQTSKHKHKSQPPVSHKKRAAATK